ncbi:hypothetical protein [Streptosporangium roseum]|uniref:hypothetical protein n=1 Tax=Streptosporangium roseum TaxID=2001 RepID=UPI0011D2A2BA|nr:hypothetical protein [Streptosporangium roseum]
MEEGILLRDAHEPAAIPGVLINDRLDLGCPPENARQLAQAGPARMTWRQNPPSACHSRPGAATPDLLKDGPLCPG